MRIMLLTTGLRLGGAEQQVAALARQFVTLGHAITVVSLTPDCEVDLPNGIQTLRLNVHKTPLSMATALCRVRRLVQTWRPDVIHAHMIHANLFARLLTRICTVPITICTAHSYREGGALRMLAYRLTDRWSDLTTHVSTDGRRRMIELGAAAAERIIVIPNGIDTNHFRPSPEFRTETRASLGVGGDEQLIVNVGRLVPEKAQSVLLDAFSMIATQTDAKLMIAGDGPIRASLEGQIARLRLSGRVSLLGKRHDIPALLNAADLFVLSSEIEGMPLVVGEALACGCPVVATDASGVADLLAGTGKPVRRGNVQGLAQAMYEALRKGRGRVIEQVERHQHIASNFGIEAIAKQWLHCYAGPHRSRKIAGNHPSHWHPV
ncbi:glycosyltransferase [Cupriavidus oxalaticus]|uniref:Glycosyltransferase n=1 Tax=Cupriavidus oxalaticus TaxID=96344 RepID=A0A5P3VIR5_9BURK|nr:glycosyltransferase [Cupriavidus oxalaticus]QEZ45141.1 glycosyltransferase [Cupriavidus oxalaticus]